MYCDRVATVVSKNDVMGTVMMWSSGNSHVASISSVLGS